MTAGELPACDVCGSCETPGECVWAVTCPACGAEPRAQCRRPGGLEPLHRARHEHAAQLRAA